MEFNSSTMRTTTIQLTIKSLYFNKSLKAEYNNNQEVLLHEIEEKQIIIRDLSKQLDRHHRNFLSLRDELTKVIR